MAVAVAAEGYMPSFPKSDMAVGRGEREGQVIGGGVDVGWWLMDPDGGEWEMGEREGEGRDERRRVMCPTGNSNGSGHSKKVPAVSGCGCVSVCDCDGRTADRRRV